MQTTDDKIALARHCLDLCERLAGASRENTKWQPAETQG